MDKSPNPGDTIRFGTGKIDWIVVSIEPYERHLEGRAAHFHLKSGMTGRRREERLFFEEITLRFAATE